jgi:hypothetical protein
VIALPGGTSPVLVGAVQDAKDGQAHGGNLPSQVDGVAGEVLGGIGTSVGPAVVCEGG